MWDVVPIVSALSARVPLESVYGHVGPAVIVIGEVAASAQVPSGAGLESQLVRQQRDGGRRHRGPVVHWGCHRANHTQARQDHHELWELPTVLTCGGAGAEPYMKGLNYSLYCEKRRCKLACARAASRPVFLTPNHCARRPERTPLVSFHCNMLRTTLASGPPPSSACYS
eukprot:scaffold106388_cov57-Phaeocystis_antarctica.AAC.1